MPTAYNTNEHPQSRPSWINGRNPAEAHPVSLQPALNAKSSTPRANIDRPSIIE